MLQKVDTMLCALAHCLEYSYFSCLELHAQSSSKKIEALKKAHAHFVSTQQIYNIVGLVEGDSSLAFDTIVQTCNPMLVALQTQIDYYQALSSSLPDPDKVCSQCELLVMAGLSAQCPSCHWSGMNVPSSQNLLTECITSSDKCEQSKYFTPEFKKMKYPWYRRRLAKSKPIQSLMDIETRVPPLSFGPLPHYVRGLNVSIDCSYVRHCSNMSGGGPGLVNQVKEVHKILDSQRSTRSSGQHSFMMLPKPPHSSFHQDGNQVAQQSLEQCKPLQTRV